MLLLIIWNDCTASNSGRQRYTKFNHHIEADELIGVRHKRAFGSGKLQTAGKTVIQIEDQPNSSGSSEQTMECGLNMRSNRWKRIIGGQNSMEGKWPWIAHLSVLLNNGSEQFHCGGVLISDNHVLTAAHCFDYLG